jgi:PAS domain S-box-containing protein
MTDAASDVGGGARGSSNDAERRLLRACHLAADTRALMQGLAACFADVSGCESIGVRLRDGDDFPYFTTVGLPAAFVRAEDSLCARDDAGEVLRDGTGTPVLEGMCGNVLCGRFDASKPFFTASGSFWTNSTSDLPARATGTDRQACTRNRCDGEGYESVALVPLRMGGQTFGLVQFSDHRPDRFTPEFIAWLEHLVDYVAIALGKFDTEAALRVSERKYRIVADNTYDWEFWVTIDDRVLYMSPSCERLTGYPVAAFTEDPDLQRRIVAAEHLDQWDRHNRTCHVRGLAGSFVYRVVRRDGESRWVEHVCQPVHDDDGRLLGVRGSNRDVTDRRSAEVARDRAEAERDQLIADLSTALAHVKTLRGFIPICSACKSVRNDAGYWQAVEVYVRDHTEAEFSHGLCPACLARLYPDLAPPAPGE